MGLPTAIYLTNPTDFGTIFKFEGTFVKSTIFTNNFETFTMVNPEDGDIDEQPRTLDLDLANLFNFELLYLKGNLLDCLSYLYQ